MKVDNEIQVEAKSEWKILPTPNVVHDANGAVDVANVDVVIPVASATITDFLNGMPGQTIKVLGTSGTSIAGTRIIRSSADPVTADRIYEFTYIEYLKPGGTLKDRWIENI